jgi:predicted ATPase
VSRATVTLAQRCPTLFIVDDLQWAGYSALELFAHLMDTVVDTTGREPIPLLIIGSSRPVKLKEHLAQLIVQRQRKGLCQTLKLSSLALSEVHEWIRRSGVACLPHQLTEPLYEVTQGKPFFIQALLNYITPVITMEGIMALIQRRADAKVTSSCAEYKFSGKANRSNTL